jgi:hypothetical protein
MAARQVEGLLIERPAGELLVLKQSTNRRTRSETAAIVFDLCDGVTTRATMSPRARRTGLPADEHRRAALTELADAV